MTTTANEANDARDLFFCTRLHCTCSGMACLFTQLRNPEGCGGCETGGTHRRRFSAEHKAAQRHLFTSAWRSPRPIELYIEQ